MTMYYFYFDRVKAEFSSIWILSAAFTLDEESSKALPTFLSDYICLIMLQTVTMAEDRRKKKWSGEEEEGRIKKEAV